MAVGDVLGIGVNGLLAFQKALATTGHNISNVNTDGYSRQRVDFSTRAPVLSGNSYLGTGTQVRSVDRVYNDFLTSQVRGNTAAYQQLDTYHTLSSQIDNVLADPNVGLTPAMNEFFSAMQDVANDPTSAAARQVAISQGQSLADRFHYLDDRLQALDQQVNDNVRNTTSEINTLAQSIADVNRKIFIAGGIDGPAPNDLLDQRDQLLNQLSERVAVTSYYQDDGSMNVLIGNGQALVVGFDAQQLSVVSNQYDPQRLEVAFVSPGGAATPVTSQLSGGTLGGTIEFRNRVLDPSLNKLGQLAAGLAKSFNDQHRLGIDLSGAFGGDFFQDIASSAPRALASSYNTGSAVISASVSDASSLTNSDYQLKFSGGNYSLTRLSDNTVTNLTGFPGTPANVDGITLSLASGAMVDGDSFLIQPTREGAKKMAMAPITADQLAVAAPISTAAALSNTGSGQISSGQVNGPPPTDPNLMQTVTLTFNNPPTSFDVSGVGTGNPVSVPYTAGADISYNGFTVQINGRPASGDVFTIQANTPAAGDNRNALAMTALQQKPILANNSASYNDFYGQWVADIGTTTHQAQLNSDAQSSLLDQAVQARDTVSGVNLDEEAANLIRFQQAYQATAQVISTANTMFQTLLNATGH